MEEGALRCSFSLSMNTLADVPMYSSSQSTWSYLYLYTTLTFLSDIISILGCHQETLDGVASCEISLDPHLTTNILKVFTKPFCVWHQNVNVHVVEVHLRPKWDICNCVKASQGIPPFSEVFVCWHLESCPYVSC